MVPVFGLMAMGGGNLLRGIEQLTTVHSEKLNSIGGSHDPVLIGAALTGRANGNITNAKEVMAACLHPVCVARERYLWISAFRVSCQMYLYPVNPLPFILT